MKAGYLFQCACGAETALSEGQLDTTMQCTECGSDFVPRHEDVREIPMNGGKPAPTGPTLDHVWQPGEIVFEGIEIDRLVGKGGMGCVYRVHHRAWGLDLAMKVPWHHVYADAVGRANFERECESWSGLGVHPHVVDCYFVRRFDETPLVFSEYLPGGSLHDWILSRRLYRGGPERALGRILDIAIQFAWGLHYAHEQNLVHRDVKPSNALIGHRRQVKVADFGLARALPRPSLHKGGPGNQPSVAAHGMTPSYASPEQAAGANLDRRTDIWSWAVSVLEMFTGGVTWMSGTVARDVLEEQVSANNESDRPSIPAGVAEILRRCLNPEPEARPITLLDVANRLQDQYYDALGGFYPRPVPGFSREQGGTIDTATRNNYAISMIELGNMRKADTLLKDAELTSRAFETIGPAPVLQEVTYNRYLLQIRTNPVFDARAVPELIPKTPDLYKYHYYVSVLLLEAGHLAAALNHVDQGLTATNPYLPQVVNVKGICLLLLGEAKPAELCFTEACRHDPKSGEYQRNRAVAHLHAGRPHAAVKVFAGYARDRRLSSDDTVRFAALLSAAGMDNQAAAWLRSAVHGPSCSTDLLLTSAELLAGWRTFIPRIRKVPAASLNVPLLIQQAKEREPGNLRCHYDAATWRNGKPLRPKVRVRRRQRLVPADEEPPEEVARFVLGGLRGFGRPERGYASLPRDTPKARYMFMSAVPAVGVALLASYYMLPPGPFQSTVEDAPRRLAGFLWAFAWAAVIIAVIRPNAVARLGKLGILECVGLPLIFYLPTAAHNAFLLRQGFLDDPAVLWRHSRLFVGLGLFLALVFVTRDMVYRLFLPRLRAFAGWSPPRQPNEEQASDSESRTDHTTASFAGKTWSLLGAKRADRNDGFDPEPVSWWAGLGGHVRHAAGRALEGARENVGTWQLLLVPQFVTLAVLDSLWTLRSPLEYPTIYTILMLLAHGAALLYAVLVPRTFIILNFGVAFFTALGLARSVGDLASGLEYPVLLGAALLFGFMNWFALQRCPAFARRWESFGHPRYEARSMLDPLCIRGSAVPWRVIQAESDRESEQFGL